MFLPSVLQEMIFFPLLLSEKNICVLTQYFNTIYISVLQIYKVIFCKDIQLKTKEMHSVVEHKLSTFINTTNVHRFHTRVRVSDSKGGMESCPQHPMIF